MRVIEKGNSIQFVNLSHIISPAKIKDKRLDYVAHELMKTILDLYLRTYN